MRGFPTPSSCCARLHDHRPRRAGGGRPKARRATGWAFHEKNRLDIDAAARTVRFGEKQEALDPAAVRETAHGWCVDSNALGRWLGIGVKVSPYSSVVTLDTKDKLPVELARERQMRAKHLKKAAAFPLEGLPTVKLAYRMWRAPALDFIVGAGVTYDAGSGLRVDRQATIRGAGEIARMSYDATIATNNRGLIPNVRFKAYRSDPDGGLLGPLDATHFAVGDVAGPAPPHRRGTGRVSEVTNRPLFSPSFDRTPRRVSRGLGRRRYRNGQLVAFGGQFYPALQFREVALAYGDTASKSSPSGRRASSARDRTSMSGRNMSRPARPLLCRLTTGHDLLGFVGRRAESTERSATTARGAPRMPRPRSNMASTTHLGAALASMRSSGTKTAFIDGGRRRSPGAGRSRVAANRAAASRCAALRLTDRAVSSGQCVAPRTLYRGA